MPNTIGPVIPDHPSRVEKAKLKISAELHSKGNPFIKALSNNIPTDQQLLNASLIAPESIPSTKNMVTPTVITQGSEGSCVAFAVGYNARSIEQYYKTGASSYNNSINVMSPEWLYDLTKASTCAGGSSVFTSLDFLKNSGIVRWVTAPYVAGACDITPTSDQWLEATNYKVTDYHYVLTTDVTGLKTLLANNHPVIISFEVDNAFYTANSSFVWTEFTGSSLGRHAVTIVGYDDTKNAYKIVNQWGTGWGDAGFSWIDYSFLQTICTYAWTIDDIVAPPVTGNYPPAAHAGFSQNILSTGIGILDGTLSTDPDGYIVTWAWTQDSGANTATITNASNPVASASGMIAGTYVFRLTVTDDGGLTAFSTVTIVVSAAVTDTITLSVVKKTVKGKVYDVLTWLINLTDPPISAQLQYGTTETSFTPLFSVIPYTSNGSFTTNAVNTKIRRYYRLRIQKSDGTYTYSTVVNVK